ncbi:MAG: Gfo/Idh/MocA family oxidoreductase [Clostridium sp.]|uniref:Gfo/Idh/MocA family protein n=1 Tax=Clostridium sp. TaxID=1506 RepID=UPI002A85AA3A|nr:Gfo/Idh/MocA family oxidoreductase [Clostridium sp.]MDY5097094.1 Gfo/Idh/MocA family oxidoreductase [Clostridium sp.]
MGGFQLTAVYSRNEETGRAFAEKYGVDTVYTSLEEFAASDCFDAVYIASPNSFHCPQSIMMMNHGKHVLCEKPVSSDLDELKSMLEVAKRNNVILLEAMRPVFDPGFEKIQELIPQLGAIRRVIFTYCQYSSRYDKFKEGTILNAFNPKLSNSALMDIGVYCVHPLVKLFGMPKGIIAKSVFLHNGMEGMGTVIAEYDGMLAELQYSKIDNSYLPSQIQGELGSILIREIPDTRTIELCLRNGQRETIIIDKHDHNMYYEVKEFIRLIESGESAEDHNKYSLMEMEMEMMDDIRKCAGISFE